MANVSVFFFFCLRLTVFSVHRKEAQAVQVSNFEKHDLSQDVMTAAILKCVSVRSIHPSFGIVLVFAQPLTF
jgi:hypothetical protein